MNLLPLFLALALGPARSPLQIQIVPETDAFSAVLTAPGPDVPAGRFTGTLTLNGSRAAVPIQGEIQRSAGQVVLPVKLRYADVPADWGDRFRADTFDYRVQGRVRGGPSVEWAGTLKWGRVTVKGDPERSADFFRFVRLALAGFSLSESEANAEIWVRNPFSFPIRIASSRYTLSANGREVGEGETRAMVLAPRAGSTLRLPIAIDNAALLATAGSAVLAGGQIEGRLSGELRVKVSRGEVALPLRLGGRMSIAR